MEDYYEILGVSPEACADDIKKAYRKAALKCHPDSSDSPDANERFTKLKEAYNILGNHVKRREYDMKRNVGPKGDFIKIGGMYFDKKEMAEKGLSILKTASSLIGGILRNK